MRGLFISSGFLARVAYFNIHKLFFSEHTSMSLELSVCQVKNSLKEDAQSGSLDNKSVNGEKSKSRDTVSSQQLSIMLDLQMLSSTKM